MPDLSDLGSTSLGVWTRRQALDRVSAGRVRALVRDGVWQTAWPGVYADAGFVLTPEQRAWAAVLASGGQDQPVPFGPPHPVTGRRRLRLRAVACGRTAARCWGLPLVDDDDPATGRREHRLDEVSVWAHLATLRQGDRELHRRRLLLAGEDMTRTRSGLLLTTPLRTLVDCAVLLPLEAAVCAADAALHRGLVTADALAAAAAARAGRPGGGRLRTVVTLADGRAESPVETLTRLLLRPVLPELEPQVRLLDGRGRVVARFDLGDRTRRLAVESDGKAAHAGSEMAARDRRRDDRSESLGWWTERVTWFDVRRRQAETVARVVRRARLLDERRAA